jgi:hypothetical protein
MIRRRQVIILFTLMLNFIAPAARASDEQTITISNFVAGVVCGQGSDMRVCFPTDDIQLTGEGHCVFDKQPIACTWHGMSFDYQLSSGEASISCDWTSSIPVNNGNPKASLANGVSSGHYDIPLTSDQHHYFLPQYVEVNTRVGARAIGHVIENAQTCSFQGKVLFQSKLRLHQPEL